MEMLKLLVALYEENPSITSGFPHEGPAKRSFDVYFAVRLMELLNKQVSYTKFETPWGSCGITVMCSVFCTHHHLIGIINDT